MRKGAPWLPLVEPASVAESHSLTDHFLRVNRLLPDNQDLVTVPPDATVAEAMKLLEEHNFSQLPVVVGNEVLGVFSYRSFSTRLLATPEFVGVALTDLTVDEFREKLNYAHVSAEVRSTFDALDADDAILVGEPNRLQGIVTAVDLLRYLYRVAEPFILLQEIELALRRLMRVCVSDEELKECVKNSLLQYYQEEKLPSTIEEMTFNDYVQIIGDGRNWPKFTPVFGNNSGLQRKLTRRRLEEIRDLRNDVFHFKREITQSDRNKLIEYRDWLWDRSKIVEQLDKEEA